MITRFLRWEAGVLGKWGATQGGRRAVESSLHGWGTGSLLLSRPTDVVSLVRRVNQERKTVESQGAFPAATHLHRTPLLRITGALFM